MREMIYSPGLLVGYERAGAAARVRFRQSFRSAFPLFVEVVDLSGKCISSFGPQRPHVGAYKVVVITFGLPGLSALTTPCSEYGF